MAETSIKKYMSNFRVFEYFTIHTDFASEFIFCYLLLPLKTKKEK